MIGMVNSMVQIAGAKQLDTETRIVALEIICSLGENRPGLIRKMPPQEIASIIQLMIHMACELEDAPEEWPSDVFQEMDDDELDDCVAGMALESLGRLGTKLGGRSIVPTVFQMIPTMLASQDWRQVSTCCCYFVFCISFLFYLFSSFIFHLSSSLPSFLLFGNLSAYLSMNSNSVALAL